MSVFGYRARRVKAKRNSALGRLPRVCVPQRTVPTAPLKEGSGVSSHLPPPQGAQSHFMASSRWLCPHSPGPWARSWADTSVPRKHGDAPAPDSVCVDLLSATQPCSAGNKRAGIGARAFALVAGTRPRCS